MNDEKFKNYIINVIDLLKKRAIEAKKDAESAKEGLKSYVQGVVMGYYSIINLLKHQAFAFCIDQKELGLADIKPDIDLLDLQRNPDIDFEEDNWATDLINEEKIKGYLNDTISLLKNQAIEAKKDVENAKEGSEDYSKGELVAFCSTISLLKDQALAFNIDEVELGLTNIDSEFFAMLKGMN